ncbi:MAG: site-2 protease family protein [Leptonema sp. (in: Bacteria)]|nr:site-2 protease family protein [Leptonema sp. (in: bacteria)]
MIALILGGVFLLGVCIVIHEMGHMLMGRLVGVRAEIFSFGYGKGIWKKKVGDTTYQITAIPLGGYVKFYGDDITDPDSKVPGGFFSAPPLIRIIPVLGGPLFNLLLGFVVFLGLSAFSGMPPANVQLWEEMGNDSPAYQAGLRNGDRILSIDGREVKTFQDVQQIAALSGGIDLPVVYSRNGKTNETVVHPDVGAGGRGNIGLRLPGERFIEVNFPFGESFKYRLATIFGVRDASQANLRAIDFLQNGDVILAVQGERISDPGQLQEILGRYHGQEIELRLKRQTIPWLAPWFTKEVTVTVPTKGEYRFELTNVIDQKYAASIGDFTLNSYVGEHQRFISDLKIDGKPAASFENLFSRFENKELASLVVGEGGATKEYTAYVQTKKIGTIGFRPGSVINAEYSTVSVGVGEILSNAVRQTVDNIMIYPEFIGRLASGRISFIENTTGPLAMFAIAGVVIKTDIRDYFQLMAAISIALMVMNLLPFPVVDGGHIVFFLIEAIMGKPLSPNVLEAVYRFGFTVLMGFGIFIMYRDFLFIIGL